jgi:hypothetical protein
MENDLTEHMKRYMESILIYGKVYGKHFDKKLIYKRR